MDYKRSRRAAVIRWTQLLEMRTRVLEQVAPLLGAALSVMCRSRRFSEHARRHVVDPLVDRPPRLLDGVQRYAEFLGHLTVGLIEHGPLQNALGRAGEAKPGWQRMEQVR
jgi:hypothetical protein